MYSKVFNIYSVPYGIYVQCRVHGGRRVLKPLHLKKIARIGGLTQRVFSVLVFYGFTIVSNHFLVMLSEWVYTL